MKKVYVAGKLNSDAVGYIQNMHRMIKTARLLRSHKYAVYVPANDFLEGLVDGGFDYHEYFDNSQPWLMSSDAVFLTPGWETSSGTKKEIELAWKKSIPVFDDVVKMNNYFSTGNTDGMIFEYEDDFNVDEGVEEEILNTHRDGRER